MNKNIIILDHAINNLKVIKKDITLKEGENCPQWDLFDKDNWENMLDGLIVIEIYLNQQKEKIKNNY